MGNFILFVQLGTFAGFTNLLGFPCNCLIKFSFPFVSALLIASPISFIPFKKSLPAYFSCISSLTCLYTSSSSSKILLSSLSTSKLFLSFSISSSYSFTITSILALNSLHVSHKSAFHPSVILSIADGFRHGLSLSSNNLGYLHILHSLSHSPYSPKPNRPPLISLTQTFEKN